MQFKSLFFALASVAAIAVAAPAPQDATATPSVTLTTALTTNTFTASKVLQSFLRADPWVTTISTHTVWTVTHTVTREAGPPPTQAARV